MTVPAWSHTALDNFENCPKQYYEVKVLKRWPFVDTAETIWGREVHKAFENFLLYGSPLRADLQMHQSFLEAFKNQPGELSGEERIALDTSLQRCHYFDKQRQVWYRGQIDAQKRDLSTGTSHILDHKTGKVKNDFSQLKGFAIFEFLTQPLIHTVKVEFYWTQLRATHGETYHRQDLPVLLGEFTPRLARFANAHNKGEFPPKPSGLCNGWCPSTDCQFWRPKRKRT